MQKQVVSVAPPINRESSGGELADDVSGVVLSAKELKAIQSQVRKIHDGQHRPFFQGGGAEMLMLMDPEKDGVSDKFFQFVSCINLFSCLLVSGLIGYVLAPASALEGVNELTGYDNQTVACWQIFCSHIQLVTSSWSMAITTYICFFLCAETPLTITRCVAKSTTIWVYELLTFLQLFLIITQCCIAAILNMPPQWAKITLTVNVGLTAALYVHGMHLLHSMFPMIMDGWQWFGPNPYTLFGKQGRKPLQRMGCAKVSEAMAHGHLGTLEPKVDVAADESVELVCRKAEEKTRQDDVVQLDEFLATALPLVREDRRKRICQSMLGDDLTLNCLVRTVRRPQGLPILVQSLDLDMAELKRGERLAIANAAYDIATAATAASGAVDVDADSAVAACPSSGNHAVVSPHACKTAM